MVMSLASETVSMALNQGSIEQLERLLTHLDAGRGVCLDGSYGDSGVW